VEGYADSATHNRDPERDPAISDMGTPKNIGDAVGRWSEIQAAMDFLNALRNLEVIAPNGERLALQWEPGSKNAAIDLRQPTPTGEQIQPTIPSQAGQSGKFLQTIGNLLQWSSGAGAYFTHVSRVATQSIPNITDTAISFDTANSNASGLWVSGSQVEVPVSGLYLAFGQVAFATNNTGIRYIFIEVNGNPVGATDSKDGMVSGPTYMNVPRPLQLAAEDVVELDVYQASGGNLNVTSADFFIFRVGD
jgi:hypothetical protein